MSDEPQLAFALNGIDVPLDRILPSKQLTSAIRKSPKYVSIMTSIKEIGVIEPLVVFPMTAGKSGQPEYLLLDGHVRPDILRQ